MAGHEPTTTRRRVLGAAAAALPLLPVIASAAKQSSPAASDPTLDCRASLAKTWTTRLARYHRLTAQAKAAETGWFRAANDAYNRACADPAADRKAAFARVSRAETSTAAAAPPRCSRPPSL
jgi:hypothetical protein